MKEKATYRTPITTMPDFGKVPPQAIQVEEAVLGAIMVASSCIDDIAEILKPEMFYKEAHQKIFGAAVTLYRKSKYADLISIQEELRNRNELESAGGPMALTLMTGKVVTTQMAVQHSYIIKTAYIQREMIRIGSELQTRGFDPMVETADLMEYAEKELYQLGDITSSKEPIGMADLLNNLANIIQIREKTTEEFTGIPSGIITLDRVTLGWQLGDLIILASRPSVGKSALGIQFATFAAKMGHPSLMFSLEMTDLQLGERYMSAETGHNSYDLKRGRNIQWAKIEKLISQGSKTPLWIDDSSSMTIYEFRSKVRRAKKRHSIELVICDYLNLFTGDEDKDNQSEKYGSISKMFKRVAKECKVAVIALAQLNRSPDQRANQLPKLSDLRNSGEIEADADIVLFPIRYAMIGKSIDERGRDLTHLGQIDIAKNRNGRTEFVEVIISEDCLKWGSVEEEIKAFTGEVEDRLEPKAAKLPF